jgi:beta-N-acetylhexosaminidase
MDREVAAGQVLVGGIEGKDLSASTRRRVEQGRLGGVILMGRNVAAPEQVRELLGAVLAATPPGLPPPLLGIDQEGGRVARLRGAPFLELPPARRLGEIDDPALTGLVARALGTQLRALGLTVDFAPVLDVDGGSPREVIGDRSFSGDPDVAARHGVAFVEGLLAAGVCPCGKHFPGHGATVRDSHVELPRVERARDALGARELPPFAAAFAAGLPLVMPAHVVFADLDAARPATTSPAVLGALLRDRLGYRGAVVTDDLVMGAVSSAGGAFDVAVDALAAGADLLLVCHDEDLEERLRAHVAAAARRSATVASRLEDAAARSLGLRRRFVPAPAAPANLARALADEVVREASRALDGHHVA